MFAKFFVRELQNIFKTPFLDHVDSSNRLKFLIKTGILRYSDLKDNPERFFEAHRLIVMHGFEHGPGFMIRFTVQYNLYAGTILELGSDSQIDQLLVKYQNDLGAFCLTEKDAGVLSGKVIQTTAIWVPWRSQFLLQTAVDGASKNWISQGLTAQRAVVIANLRINDADHGPHAFIVNLRNRDGSVCSGIELSSLGKKTIANDLDNASIKFNNVFLNKDALLNKHCDVIDNEYVRKNDIVNPIDRIGQRLYTGRLAVAQAANVFRDIIFTKAKSHCDNKISWHNGASNKPRSLSDIHQIKSLFYEARRDQEKITRFLSRVERDLCSVLKRNALPDQSLIEKINAAKIVSVDSAISFTNRLKEEVGSYALIHGSGFENLDFLYCCRFAEGDSRILLLKIANDRLRNFDKRVHGLFQIDDILKKTNELQMLVDRDAMDNAALFDFAYCCVDDLIERTSRL